MSVERIQARLTEERGIDPASLSRVGMTAAVRRRMQALGIDDLGHYADRIVIDGAEFERLVAAVLVHETSFFRYPASFEVLAAEALARTRDDPRATFRVSCVASSTGEEPASAVITLFEAGLSAERFHVDACDLSARAVEYAEAGRYNRRGIERLPDAQRGTWFRRDGDQYRLRRRVRERIRTRQANALAPSFGLGAVPYDAIFCRNLLIYLVPEARVKLLETLVRMLRPGGLLFVGHAEITAARAMGLSLEPPPAAFVCRRVVRPDPLPARTTPVAPPPVARRRPPTPRPPPPRAPTVEASEDALARASRHADAGNLTRAREVLRASIAVGQVSADHFHLLGLVESARGNDDACEAALRRALYLDPKHYPSLMQLALLHDARGERGRARRLREKAERVKGDGDDA